MKNKIPKLRFPGFGGEWEEKRLGEVAEVVGGGTPDTTVKDFWGGDIMWFTPTEIKQKYLSQSERTITSEGVARSSATILPVGAVLLTTRATIGDVGIAVVECATNQGFQSFIVHDDHSNEFWNYWLIQNKKEFVRRANGSTFSEISGTEIRKIKTLVPSLREQQKIASFLTAVDEWIGNLKAQKQKWEEYKKGMMQKIFSREIRFKPAPRSLEGEVGEEDGNDFPDWEEKRLGEVVSFLKGRGISKDDVSADGKMKCVRYGELYTVYGEVVSQVVSRTAVPSTQSLVSKSGDLLIPSSGETAWDIATATCLLEAGILIGGDLNVLRFHDKHDSRFFAYYLSHGVKRMIAGLAQGNSVVHLYASHLKSLGIRVPVHEEQQKIAGFLTAVDDMIHSYQQRIAQAEEWKKGLMQRMFI